MRSKVTGLNLISDETSIREPRLSLIQVRMSVKSFCSAKETTKLLPSCFRQLTPSSYLDIKARRRLLMKGSFVFSTNSRKTWASRPLIHYPTYGFANAIFER
jgi:hypothetical protein